VKCALDEILISWWFF